MGVYLDELRSTLNDVQARHITNLLRKQKDSGQIQNLEDFRNQLSQLTATILADKVSPSLQLFFGQLNQVIDSASYDFMLDRIHDDLEAIFSELNTLDEIIDAHNNLVNNVILNAIKFGINELDNKVSLYEFLASDNNGFNQSLFNTFSANQTGRTFRTDPDVGILFQDPRTQNVSNNDVTLDTVGEQILLGTNIVSYIQPKSVIQIFDNEATQSADLVSFSTNNINNVIDGADGTYWTYSILQKSINSTGVYAKLQLDLGVCCNINFIEIESASVYPMNLVRIEYIDGNNIIHNINIFENLLSSANRISFAKINASKINIVIQQLSAVEVQYENKVVADNFDAALNGESPTIDTNSIAAEIRANITSSTLLTNALMVAQVATPNTSVKYYDYIIGFDNIRIGYADYANDSIFVSSQITVNGLSQIGLKATERRPLENSGVISITNDTYPSTDPGFFLGSIEYYSIMQNYNSNNQLIDINTIALLPIGTSYISHENLLLAYKVGTSSIFNTGILRFYTLHFTDDDLTAIKVYRNGTLLTRITDWIIEESPYTNDVIPPTGIPNTVGIRILNPSNLDFYTVSYTPLFSTTRVHPTSLNNIDLNFDTGGIKVIDVIGDASITIDTNNIANVTSNKNGQMVAYTKLNLAVILRTNSVDLQISPAVEDYTFLLNNIVT